MTGGGGFQGLFRTDSSIIAVNELVLSQEDVPQTHHAKSAERPVSVKLVMRNDLQQVPKKLRQRLVEVWFAMPQCIIDEAIDWRKHTLVVVHLLKADISNTSYDT